MEPDAERACKNKKEKEKQKILDFTTQESCLEVGIITIHQAEEKISLIRIFIQYAVLNYSWNLFLIGFNNYIKPQFNPIKSSTTMKPKFKTKTEKKKKKNKSGSKHQVDAGQACKNKKEKGKTESLGFTT